MRGIVDLKYLNSSPLSLSLTKSLAQLSCLGSPVLSQLLKAHRNAKNKTLCYHGYSYST